MIIDTTQSKVDMTKSEEVNKLISDLEDVFPNCGSESAKLVLRCIDMIKRLAAGENDDN